MRIEEATLSIHTQANERMYRKLCGVTGLQRLGGGIPFDLPAGPKRITLEVEVDTNEPIGVHGAATDTMVETETFGLMFMDCELRLDADERLYTAVAHILGQSEDMHLKARADRSPDEQKTVEDALREKITNLQAGNASLRRKLDEKNEEITEMYDKWQEAVAS
jgi:hypothetical protein